MLLPSGRSAALSVLRGSAVKDLKLQAQIVFGQGLLQLIAASGRVLADPMELLNEAGVGDGDHVTSGCTMAGNNFFVAGFCNVVLWK